MSILQFIWVGDLDESKTQRLQNPQALSYDRCHPKKMVVRQDKKETRIGRKNSKMPPDYALESAVSNRMISRNHVTIERLSKGNYMLYDHSLNGTYVNFVRVIGGTILKHEDVVCFGHINGANIKPGESVTPFATDLKYRVEIIDKIGVTNDKSSGSIRKGDTYSQSESSQYDEVSTEQKQKKAKHKPINDKTKKMKLAKPESDESDQSSDSSEGSNNNLSNTYKKQKKPADLSSLSSSDDDRLKSSGKDRQQFSKKPIAATATAAAPPDKPKKHSTMPESRLNDLSARKRKSGNENNINSKIGFKKSHDVSAKRPMKTEDDRRMFSSGVKERKLHLNQKSHSKPKYSDNNGNSNKSSTKRNVNMNSNYDYEECSAHPCLRPDGENLIDWIMCDKCAQWFHQSCVGLDEAVEDDESYYCPYCVH